MDINELESFKLSDAVTFHKELNPKLWEGNKLDPAVRDQLLVIAEDFVEYLGISNLKVRDVTISGSNAAYSYTPHSDLDLHILVDFNELPNNEVYQELFTAKKTLYNDAHDITVRDVPVELYVQDTNQPHVSLGEYSIVYDKWIRIPKKRRANFDEAATKAKYEKLGDLIELALKSRDPKRVNDTLALIKRYRKSGLEKAGEFGPENLAFKAIRKQGLIQDLHDLKAQLHAEKLSIDEYANEDYDPNGPPPGPEFKPTMPAGTVRVDVSDVYDWYKLGQHISNMKGLGKHDFGKGPPSTILSFGDEDTEHKYIQDLEKTGLTTTDIDPVDPKQPKGMKRQKTDPTFNVNETDDRKAAVLKIQKHLNKKYGANLDLDGKLGPLTLKSINKFMPRAKTGLADEPNKTTAVQGKKLKEAKIDAHRQGDTIWINYFEVPEKGKGLGTQEYMKFEKSLPKDIKKIRLVASDAGYGPTHEFWDRMGFDYAYPDDDNEMVKLLEAVKFKVQKGKNKFSTELLVSGEPVGIYQYDATTGRSIAEIYPEFKGKGLGKLLVLHAIYTAAQLGLDFIEDDSRTAEYDNVLDSLSSNGYIVDDDGYWYVTGDGEQYLKQSLKEAHLVETAEENQIINAVSRAAADKIVEFMQANESKILDMLLVGMTPKTRLILFGLKPKDLNVPSVKDPLLNKLLKTMKIKVSTYKNWKNEKDTKIYGEYYEGDNSILLYFPAHELAAKIRGTTIQSEVASTLSHEIQHALDDLKSQGKALADPILYKGMSNDYQSYLKRPYEVNARFQQATMDIAEYVAMPKKDGSKATQKDLPELIRYAFEKNQLDKIYEKNQKEYKRLLSRAYKFFQAEMNAPKKATPQNIVSRAVNWIMGNSTKEINEASGYIPSEKEKNDPRFKTALTVDVKPDSIKKNAKAFNWKTSRAGIPPQARADGKLAEDLMREFKSFLLEDKQPKVGYHVTATKNLPVIRKNGIKADSRGNSYVWDSFEMAEWFTDFQNDEGQDRTILKIDMTGIDARPDPEAEDMSEWSSRFKPGTNGGAWIVTGSIPPDKIIG